MNHKLGLKNNILENFDFNSSRFEIPIISSEDTSIFSMKFINQKDMAMMPIYLDDNLPFDNSECINNKDEKNMLNKYQDEVLFTFGNCINNINVVVNLNNS